VFLLVMVEDFGVPSPGETVLVIGAGAAATGMLNIWLVLLAAFLGAVIGDNIGYAVGRFGGRPLVLRVGSHVGITATRFDYAESFFRRFGEAIVMFARFVEILRQLNGIIAGVLGMHWARFLAYNALGAALWVGAWGAVGYFAGEHIHQVSAWFARFSWLALVLLVGALVVAWLVHRRRAASADERAASDEG